MMDNNFNYTLITLPDPQSDMIRFINPGISNNQQITILCFVW